MKQKNATIYAELNEKGFISLFLEVEGIHTKINVCDFNGTQKNKASKLTYKIYKTLEGK